MIKAILAQQSYDIMAHCPHNSGMSMCSLQCIKLVPPKLRTRHMETGSGVMGIEYLLNSNSICLMLPLPSFSELVIPYYFLKYFRI